MRAARPPFPPAPADGEDGLYGSSEADLGDIVVLLLAGTLKSLRDQLVADGFCAAADLISDLIDVADDYIANVARL